MADEIILVDYDPSWPQRYEQERAQIARVLHGVPVEIHHIGSTSVPGLAAKPIIDIMVGFEGIPQLSVAQLEGMLRLGYEYKGENGIPGRQYFRKGSPRTHHVHMVARDSEGWQVNLLFRDYLRAHPEEAEAYAVLKRELAGLYREKRAVYTDSKAPFISEVLERARVWAAFRSRT